MMEKDIAFVIKSEEEIAARVAELADVLNEQYKDKDPVFIGVLKGSFIFMADLMRKIDLYCDMDFMAVSSYGSGSVTSGQIKITKDLTLDIKGRHVVIIEDILDSGLTLDYLKKYLMTKEPASLSVCALLDKKARRQVDVGVDLIGFNIPDAFAVGYGLDYAQKYRNLPYIGVLKPSVYSK
ncbi:MAG: hypoxanthine phosphoribosyltransferase [Oscillospiraceae bacterium]|nr:hypoxanthine phosphoribosyltransferase [Oscillospiraceae bacterium]